MTNQEQVHRSLNQQIADWTVLYTKLHNFHWYVKGPTFFVLHAKFEELYTQAATYIDELAERLLAIGGHPVATLTESLELSAIKEAKQKLSAEDMVSELSHDFNQIISELKKGQQQAEDAHDDMTADIFLSMITDLEKHNWMLQSYLNE
ncbi:DNA starvation/stationary phase protection protein [Macrococcus hajekii]|uniref:DNA starvation/stationary phase protection protein n=1 Tax=Macrococcus hajekii TaxID=198482 RepID=A0A4R6BJ30_9STAP|nr:Dps family protein [Macrococcus hajekii]TDM01600.1 DNA starvation/stationary phase protection protein [Macrococcus hajekii]GGB01368.1 DNA starvation/stationary phase protection protein [Macrococcus hajekii]